MKTTPLTHFIAPKYWPTWLGLAVLRLFSLLPLPILTLLGYFLGVISYCLMVSRRKIAFRNIRVCFPELTDKEVRKINFQHFCFIGQSVFTVPMNFWISDKRFLKLVEVRGREHYDLALAEGKNIILLAPHFISLDVGGYVLARERPMITMYQYTKNQLVDNVVKKGRVRFGGFLVERKEPLRKLIRLIREGHPFYYLPDQDAGRKGIFVPFFHQPASTVPMLGKFTEMTDAVVIPCSTRIKPWGQGYEVILGEPMVNFPQGNEYADTVAMNESVAQMIRAIPEQYFWVHKRFKTQQDSNVNFYK